MVVAKEEKKEKERQTLGREGQGGDKEQQGGGGGGGGGGGDFGACFKMTSEANPHAGAFDLDVNVSVFESNIRIMGAPLGPLAHSHRPRRRALPTLRRPRTQDTT